MTEEYSAHTTQVPNRSRSFEDNVIDRLGRIETRIDYIESNIRDYSTDKKQMSNVVVAAVCSSIGAVVATVICYMIGLGPL
jgi:hypothetical protein